MMARPLGKSLPWVRAVSSLFSEKTLQPIYEAFYRFD